MNRIYTSYYAKIGQFNPKDFIRCQISRYCPVPDLIDIRFNQLYPSDDLLKKSKQGLISHDEYTKLYIEQLTNLGYESIKYKLDKLVEITNRNVVLFCYEAPEKFCHRHVFADWYNKNENKEVILEYENL